ncbi:unnamed protein product, partial [Tilletia caries]
MLLPSQSASTQSAALEGGSAGAAGSAGGGDDGASDDETSTDGESDGVGNAKNKGKAKRAPASKRKVHKWSIAEEMKLAAVLWTMDDLQARLLGRKTTGSGRSERGKLTADLNQLGKEVHGTTALAPQHYRHKVKAMHKKYIIARDQLSETGQNVTGTEVVDGSKVQKERALATRQCHYFEEWHEMALDRRSTRPPRVRMPGTQSSSGRDAVGSKRKRTSSSQDHPDTENEGGQDGEEESADSDVPVPGSASEGEDESGREEAEDGERDGQDKDDRQAGSSTKRSRSKTTDKKETSANGAGTLQGTRGPYRGSDNLAQLRETLQQSTKESAERQKETMKMAMENQQREQDRRERELVLAERRQDLEEKR